MAGLKKPEFCQQCQSKNLIHEFHPERWVCENQHVVITRKSKPQTGVCIKCHKKKSDGIEFKSGKNLCMDCYNNYMNDWYLENHDREKTKKRDYYKKNRVELRDKANAYWQSTIEHYISDLHHRVKNCAVKRFGKKNRVVPFNITKQNLLDLYTQQNGRCALSNLIMVHEWGSLYSISVDRIDPSGGYTIDNIQLTTKAANLLKNDHTNQEALDYFQDIRNTSMPGSNTIQSGDIGGFYEQ